MITFQDFEPEVTKAGGFLTREEREPLMNVVMRANAWIDHNNLEVMNIETVVLPSIHDRHENGSTDPILSDNGEHSTNWYQIIRVWYRY